MRHTQSHAEYPQPKTCEECRTIERFITDVRHALEALDEEERQRALDLEHLYGLFPPDGD